jgi:hypothetical protein
MHCLHQWAVLREKISIPLKTTTATSRTIREFATRDLVQIIVQCSFTDIVS